MSFILSTKKLLAKFQNTVFHKILIIILISSIIPMIVSDLLAVKHSTDHIINQAGQTTKKILFEKKQIIEYSLAEIDKIIFQHIANFDISKLLTTDQLTSSHYFKMSEITKLFISTVDSNPHIHSIYFFDDKHDFVLADTKYSKDDFYDPEIFEFDFAEDFYITGARVVKDRKTISYIRKYESFSKDVVGFFVVNLDYDAFFKDLLSYADQHALDVILLNKDSSLLFTNNQKFNSFDNKALSNISPVDVEFTKKKIEGSYYFINQITSESLGWKYICLQKYSLLVQPAQLLKSVIISSSTIILLFSMILAYFFSIYLYKPLAYLVVEMGKYLNISTTKDSNEYKTIDNAVKNLFNQNVDLLAKYQYAFPYYKKYSLKDLLTDQNFNSQKFENILSTLGVYFVFDKYYIAIFDFENLPSEISHTTVFKPMLDNIFSRYTKELLHISVELSDLRIAMIMNTSSDSASINKMFQEIKEKFNSDNIELTISLGKTLHSLDDIGDSYRKVLFQLNNKFFIGKNELIYGIDIPEINRDIFYNKSIEEDLLNSIKAQNSEKADATLVLLTESLVKNITYIEYIKYVFFQISSNIFNVLAELGIEFSDTDMTTTSIFEQIQKASTIHDLQQFMQTLIEKSIYLISGLKEKQHHNLASKALEFIEKNYTKDLTLEEIANVVFLSPRHLSNVFKAATGLTIFDYITKLRMNAAKDLLEKQNIKIQDIAQLVGYNNVQSFIRFFKKTFGITPIQYKRKCIGNTDIDE